MSDPWISVLKKLPLSRTEREVVKRYEADPFGRTFLPVADILRSHRLVDEALELLTQGVERHPTFTVARVVLGRELYQKGLILQAWRTLEDSPVPLRENVLAQKLRFKIAMLLAYEAVARSTYQHLQLSQMLDTDTKRLGELLEISGLGKARDRLLRDLRERGTEIVLPPEALVESAQEPGRPEGDERTLEISITQPQGPAHVLFQDADVEPSIAMEVAQFHVVPLDEIFNPGESSEAFKPKSASTQPGIELDSSTLAEIYAKQGHYAKALGVLRRLLRLSPGNDLLRRRLSELTKLEREQREADLTVDNAVIDKLETVEILDRQIRFYSDLLGRLS